MTIKILRAKDLSVTYECLGGTVYSNVAYEGSLHGGHVLRARSSDVDLRRVGKVLAGWPHLVAVVSAYYDKDEGYQLGAEYYGVRDRRRGYYNGYWSDVAGARDIFEWALAEAEDVGPQEGQVLVDHQWDRFIDQIELRRRREGRVSV